MTPDEQLEATQWDYFWAPEDTTVVDRPEIRYVHHPSDRTELNSVVRTRASAEQLPRLIDEVAKLQGKASTWLVVETVDCVPLETALARAGYADSFAARGYTVGTSNWKAPRPTDHLRVERVTTEQHLRDVISVRNQAFGTEDKRVPDAQIAQELAMCAPEASRVQRFVVYDGEEPISSGGLTKHPFGFGFLWAGGTVPSGRGKGAYTALVEARIRYAERLSIPRVGLYARLSTSAPIIAAQGFEPCGRMFYWRRPS